MKEFDNLSSLIQVGQETPENIREVLGPKVAFHYTIRHTGHHTTYGLYERVGEARGAQQENFSEKERPTFPVVRLKKGERYESWGTPPGVIYEHGKNDGEHGSKELRLVYN